MILVIKTGFILIILAAIGIYAFFWAKENQTKEALLFFGFMILLFTIIYATSVLNYKISGAVDISKLEQTKQEVYVAKKEVEEITNGLMEISFILADGSSRWGGMPQEHLNEIKKIYEKLPISNKNINKIENKAKEKIEEINKIFQEKNMKEDNGVRH